MSFNKFLSNFQGFPRYIVFFSPSGVTFTYDILTKLNFPLQHIKVSLYVIITPAGLPWLQSSPLITRMFVANPNLFCTIVIMISCSHDNRTFINRDSKCKLVLDDIFKTSGTPIYIAINTVAHFMDEIV